MSHSVKQYNLKRFKIVYIRPMIPRSVYYTATKMIDQVATDAVPYTIKMNCQLSQ